MQVPNGMYSGLECDRQLKDQKCCQFRDNYYILETKRRLKAIEDRKKKEQLREQQQKANILQQHKQRKHEERQHFQKAMSGGRAASKVEVKKRSVYEAPRNIQQAQTVNTHQPPHFCGTNINRASKVEVKKRSVYEAHRNIQQAQTVNTHQPPHFCASTINRRCSHPSKPPGGPSNPYSLQVGAADQAYAKYMQERNQANWNEVTSQLLKKQAQIQTQEYRDTRVRSSESRFSRDSLENEDSHASLIDSLDLSKVNDTRGPISLQGQINSPSPSSMSTNHCPPEFYLHEVKQEHGPISLSFSTPSVVKDESAAQQSNETGQSRISNIHAAIPPSSDHINHIWVSPPAHSVRTDSATVLPQAQCGRIFKPSSSQVVRNQGRILVAKPPPKPPNPVATQEYSMYSAKTCNNIECYHGKTRMAVDQSKGHPQSLKMDKDTIFAPVPPSYAYKNETASKDIYRPLQSDGKVGKDCKVHTPRDTQLEQLWNELRYTLASKQVRTPIKTQTQKKNMVKNTSATLAYRNPPVSYQAPVPMTAIRTYQMLHNQRVASVKTALKGIPGFR